MRKRKIDDFTVRGTKAEIGSRRSRETGISEAGSETVKVQSRYYLSSTYMAIAIGMLLFQEFYGCSASSTCWTQKVRGHLVIANAVGDWHEVKYM
ncbi:hypothetical protein RRG08_015795 [Elysia crispata]|uniref:Uncharacterized protein n=1 Tax=Elysia crispata TaxID=231223 RepID=A0AAE1BAD1_9GAST|nr:hypothetical protein RRG08_015795 [Elysia crispata]